MQIFLYFTDTADYECVLPWNYQHPVNRNVKKEEKYALFRFITCRTWDHYLYYSCHVIIIILLSCLRTVCIENQCSKILKKSMQICVNGTTTLSYICILHIRKSRMKTQEGINRVRCQIAKTNSQNVRTHVFSIRCTDVYVLSIKSYEIK